MDYTSISFRLWFVFYNPYLGARGGAWGVTSAKFPGSPRLDSGDLSCGRGDQDGRSAPSVDRARPTWAGQFLLVVYLEGRILLVAHAIQTGEAVWVRQGDGGATTAGWDGCRTVRT